MTRPLHEIISDSGGQSAFEYALLLAVVGGGIAIGSLFLGDSIANALIASGEAIVSWVS